MDNGNSPPVRQARLSSVPKEQAWNSCWLDINEHGELHFAGKVRQGLNPRDKSYAV
jgi:hypothetical protein